ISELIKDNADYLVSSITLDFTPYAKLIVCCNATNTLFEYSTIDILAMISSLDLKYDYSSELFLTPFYQLIGFFIQAKIDFTTHSKCSNSPIFKTYPNKSVNRSNNDDVQKNNRNVRWIMTWIHDGNPYILDHLQIVEEVSMCKIMLRCIHLVADGNPKLRIPFYECFKRRLFSVGNETNLLLPIVHKIWTSLIEAFDLLTVLSKVAGNFIRQRASSEIIPPLVLFLTRGASVSASASQSYKYLTSYRVQNRLLRELGPFCRETGILSQSLRPVIGVLVMYLDDLQPEGLQQASMSSIEIIWTLDPGSTWALLISYLGDFEIQNIYSQRLVKPFEAIQIRNRSMDMPKDTNLKLKNISILLNKLHGNCDTVTK
ncbi:TELO2-interacting protein 1, partial [Schistosoma japonicum]